MRIQKIESKTKWESFILTYSPESLFQSWDWGEVQQRLGNPVFRYQVCEGKTIRAVFQGVLVKAKRGNFIHVRHGPILSTWDTSTFSSIIDFLRHQARSLGALFIRVSPLVADTPKMRHIFCQFGFRPSPIHAMDGELCWVLSLDINEDQILGSMRKTTRYEIRRAEKLGVWVKVANDSHDIGKFLALYEKTSKRQGFTAHTGIREEFEVFVKEGNAKLYLGYFQKTLVAGALILYYGGQAIYHHGASIHSLAPVSTLIQWQAIKDAKKAGLKVYNFWGIAPSGKNRHPWQGLTLFKKGFGGKELNYHHAMDLPLHPLYAFTYVSELLRKWKKGY